MLDWAMEYSNEQPTVVGELIFERWFFEIRALERWSFEMRALAIAIIELRSSEGIKSVNQSAENSVK